MQPPRADNCPRPPIPRVPIARVTPDQTLKGARAPGMPAPITSVRAARLDADIRYRKATHEHS